MTDDRSNGGPSPSSSVTERGGLRNRVVFWFLLGGNRIAVSACIVATVVVVVAALLAAGILDVGPGSTASTVFGSGLTSGVLTLVTIALSINQLILSRVFGTPDDLRDRLDGTRTLRETVERLADEPSSPNDPAAFLSMIARAVSDRAGSLEESVTDTTGDATTEAAETARTLREYGDAMEGQLEENADIVDVLDVILGTAYAENLTALRHLDNAHGASLPRAARHEIDALDGLLEAVAIARQFFKTLSIQQDFARLSRIIVYSGLIALATSISIALVYRQGSTTVRPWLLPLIVSLGMGVIFSPIAAFVAYVLRGATIARRTVSVGPFVPPEER